MRQSKTRKNFFKPRYNLILKTKSVLWSNIFKMRKVIKKRKWRSVFFDFRPLKLLTPNLRRRELKQLQKTNLLYNPFSIFVKNQFKFNSLNNFNFLQNKTRLIYLNIFSKISNNLFETLGNVLHQKNVGKKFNLVKVLYNMLYNLTNKKLNLSKIFKKINFFFNFLKKNFDILNSQKTFLKKYNFKKYAVLRKTNNFHFFINYRDYIENEVINSIFFKRGRFRTTKMLENDVLQNKMSSIFINSFAIKLTKKKVIRNFFAINSVKKFKRMLSKSVIKGKRFNLQRKLSQFLLLKLNTTIHTLGWSKSILDSKKLLNNNEVFLNKKIMRHPNHVLKCGDIIHFKKSSLNTKHINIDPRVRKLATMKKGTRLYTKLFEGLLERFKNGYKPTGTSIWYIFKRKRAIERKYMSRRLKRPFNRSRIRSKSFNKKKHIQKKKLFYFRRNMFFNRQSRDILSRVHLFRKKLFRKRNYKKVTEYHKRKREFFNKAKYWPLFAQENRADLLNMTSNLELKHRPKRFLYNHRELKIRKFFKNSGRIQKYSNLLSNFQSKYKRFSSKYPRIFLDKKYNQKINQNFYTKNLKTYTHNDEKLFLQKNMHLLVPFSFLEYSSMKMVYPSTFQMKRRKIIFARFEKKTQRKKRAPFRMRYANLLKHVVQPILNFSSSANSDPILSRNIYIKNKNVTITDNFFLNKHKLVRKNYNSTQNMLLNIFWYNKQKYHKNNLISFTKPLKLHNSFLLNNYENLQKTLVSGQFSSFYLNNFKSNQGVLTYFKNLVNKKFNQKFQNNNKNFIKLAMFQKLNKKFFKDTVESSFKNIQNENFFKKSLKFNPSLKKYFNNQEPLFLQNSKKKLKYLKTKFFFILKNKKFYNTRNLYNLLNQTVNNKVLKFKADIILKNQKVLLKKLINFFLLRKKHNKKQKILSKKIMKYKPRPAKYRRKLKWRSSERAQNLFKNFKLPSSYVHSKEIFINLKKKHATYTNFFIFRNKYFMKTNFLFFTTPSLQVKLYKAEMYKIYSKILSNSKKPFLQYLNKKKMVSTTANNFNLITQSYNMMLQNDSKLNLIYRLMDNNLGLFKKSSDVLPPKLKLNFINTQSKGILKKLMSQKIKAPFLEYKRFMAIVVDLPNPSTDFIKRNSLYLNNNNLYRLLK